MARIRNWDPRVYAEVFVRLDHGQATSTVARATGVSYQQVQSFEAFMRANPGRLPPNIKTPTAEMVNELHQQVAAEIAAAATVAATPTPSEEELEAEIVGCIDLVRQAASQFKMRPRKFLWLCMTHARSA